MSRAVSDAVTIFRREWLRYRRDRAYWLGQAILPLAVVGFIGFGLNGVVRLPTGTDYVSHLASGVLVLVVSSGAIGAGFTLIEDRDSGFLRALMIAPVSRASIVLGKLAARVVASVVFVGLLVAMLTAFTPIRPASPGAALLAVIAVSAVFVALGIALAAPLRRLESFRLLAALVTVPLYLLSGIFYPVSTLPTAMRALAYANPLTYGVDLFRYGLLGVHEVPLAWTGGVLAVLTVAAGTLAVVVFDRRASR